MSDELEIPKTIRMVNQSSALEAKVAELEAENAELKEHHRVYSDEMVDTLTVVKTQRAKAERECDELKSQLTESQERVLGLEKGINAIEQLIDESSGVYGLHLNGDPSPWEELREGGQFEEWMLDFDVVAKPDSKEGG